MCENGFTYGFALGARTAFFTSSLQPHDAQKRFDGGLSVLHSGQSPGGLSGATGIGAGATGIAAGAACGAAERGAEDPTAERVTGDAERVTGEAERVDTATPLPSVVGSSMAGSGFAAVPRESSAPQPRQNR